jgi:hypothetical protein
MFDPNTFLSETVTGANDTKYVPVPQGEYPAIIKEVKARQMDRKDRPGEKSTVADIVYEIDDANVKQVTGLDNPTVRQSVWLDLTPNGKLDMSKGKNIQLGKLREALGLNDDTKPFSFDQLPGRAAIIAIEHNPGKNEGEVFANVSKVGKL